MLECETHFAPPLYPAGVTHHSPGSRPQGSHPGVIRREDTNSEGQLREGVPHRARGWTTPSGWGSPGLVSQGALLRRDPGRCCATLSGCRGIPGSSKNSLIARRLPVFAMQCSENRNSVLTRRPPRLCVTLIRAVSLTNWPAMPSDSRLPTPDSRLPTPDSRLSSPNSRLPKMDVPRSEWAERSLCGATCMEESPGSTGHGGG